jgi:hypothetical protein
MHQLHKSECTCEQPLSCGAKACKHGEWLKVGWPHC